jgi:hypothetical protein
LFALFLTTNILNLKAGFSGIIFRHQREWTGQFFNGMMSRNIKYLKVASQGNLGQGISQIE